MIIKLQFIFKKSLTAQKKKKFIFKTFYIYSDTATNILLVQFVKLFIIINM